VSAVSAVEKWVNVNVNNSCMERVISKLLDVYWDESKCSKCFLFEDKMWNYSQC